MLTLTSAQYAAQCQQHPCIIDELDETPAEQLVASTYTHEDYPGFIIREYANGDYEVVDENGDCMSHPYDDFGGAAEFILALAPPLVV